MTKMLNLAIFLKNSAFQNISFFVKTKISKKNVVILLHFPYRFLVVPVRNEKRKNANTLSSHSVPLSSCPYKLSSSTECVYTGNDRQQALHEIH
jgi:hypothetical protein